VAPEILEWRDFFVTTATVAGALVGLLFVAVSLHLRLLSEDRHADLRLDARSNLIGYVVALSLSLVPLIPQPLSALAVENLVAFVALLGVSVRTWPNLLRSRPRVYDRTYVWFRVALLAATDISLLVGGVGLLGMQIWPIYLLAAGVASVLVVSIFRTWDIIFRAARVRGRA
jgi:hypothetical protein